MGANPTQAAGVLLFLVAAVFISLGLYSGGSVIWLLAGLVAAGASVAVFRKCRPWEHNEE